MKRFSSVLAVIALAIVPACSSDSSTTTSCFETASGVVCVATQGLTTEDMDVDGDGTIDQFICADSDDEADEDSDDRDSDGVADSEDDDDDNDGIADADDADDDDDGIADEDDCDDYDDVDDDGVEDADEADEADGEVDDGV